MISAKTHKLPAANLFSRNHCFAVSTPEKYFCFLYRISKKTIMEVELLALGFISIFQKVTSRESFLICYLEPLLVQLIYHKNGLSSQGQAESPASGTADTQSWQNLVFQTDAQKTRVFCTQIRQEKSIFSYGTLNAYEKSQTVCTKSPCVKVFLHTLNIFFVCKNSFLHASLNYCNLG